MVGDRGQRTIRPCARRDGRIGRLEEGDSAYDSESVYEGGNRRGGKWEGERERERGGSVGCKGGRRAVG